MIPTLFRSAQLASAMLVAAPVAAQQPAGKSVFAASDFARFAPRTAYDMLVQVPGFAIRSTDGGRGLGQATENVLINGQRIANKSGGALDELQRTAASSVERIELVDAAQLGIAGLSGQVANVVLKAEQKGTGQFEWRPEFRAHYAHPRWISGKLNYNDKAGPFDYKISADNNSGRGAYGGPVLIRDPAGLVTERRSQNIWSDYEHPRFTVGSAIDMPGSSVASVSVALEPYFSRYRDFDRRLRTDGHNRTRITRQEQDGHIFDANADYAFALGPGRLKLIGVHHFELEPTVTTQVTAFDSGAPDDGIKFDRLARISENIGRAEYNWKTGANGFQLSLERADNRLNQRGLLYLLDPTGEFVLDPERESSGIVQERRYEGLLTWSRALGPRLDLQLVAGGEISRLERVDGDLPARKFFRPKGSLTLGWRPNAATDVSLKLNRKVGQISFYDFLSQPKLSDDRENSGNPDLVPPQSWEAEVEVARKLGPWGQTRLRAYHHLITDIVDIIPIGLDGEGVGNLPKARRTGVEWISTFNFDPLGFRGAKLDATLGLQRTSVRDPLTGEKRPISGSNRHSIELSLRHDIPQSDYAWGASVSHSKNVPYYYLTEVNRVWEGPWFDSLFIENKNVLGMTVRASVINLLNARHRQERSVYGGRRNVSPLLFRQSHNQLIGPIFSFSVRGSF